MKKFFKTIGNIIAIPLRILFIMYAVPLFLIDYFINLLEGTSKEWIKKAKTYYNIFKFGLTSILAGKEVTVTNMLKIDADGSGINYTKISRY